MSEGAQRTAVLTGVMGLLAVVVLALVWEDASAFLTRVLE